MNTLCPLRIHSVLELTQTHIHIQIYTFHHCGGYRTGAVYIVEGRHVHGELEAHGKYGSFVRVNVDMTHATTGATCLSVTARTYNMSHTAETADACHSTRSMCALAAQLCLQRKGWFGRRPVGGLGCWMAVEMFIATWCVRKLWGGDARHNHTHSTTCDGRRHVRSPHKVRDAAAKVASRIP